MFGPVQPTRYDLAFSLFGIPVRVTPWFWLAGVLLGWGLMRDPQEGMMRMLIWLGVVFVSILVHEMGHATVAALFGYPPRIMLYQFGGMAMFEPTHHYTTARSILISAAGPAFGFALGMAVIVVTLLVDPANLSSLGSFAIEQLIWVNIAWTCVNLLPVLPLDGGQICRDVCIAVSPRAGMTVSLSISVAVAGLVGAGFLYISMTYAGIFFIVMAVQNFQELQHRRSF